MLSSFLNYFTCNFDAWLKTLCLLCIMLVLIFNNHFFFATMYTLSTVLMPGLLHIFNEIHFITLKKILFFSLYLFTMLFFPPQQTLFTMLFSSPHFCKLCVYFLYVVEFAFQLLCILRAIQPLHWFFFSSGPLLLVGG